MEQDSASCSARFPSKLSRVCPSRVASSLSLLAVSDERVTVTFMIIYPPIQPRFCYCDYIIILRLVLQYPLSLGCRSPHQEIRSNFPLWLMPLISRCFFAMSEKSISSPTHGTPAYMNQYPGIMCSAHGPIHAIPTPSRHPQPPRIRKSIRKLGLSRNKTARPIAAGASNGTNQRIEQHCPARFLDVTAYNIHVAIAQANPVIRTARSEGLRRNSVGPATSNKKRGRS